jgi:hypothetical protein
MFTKCMGKAVLLTLIFHFFMSNQPSFCQENGYIIMRNNEFRGGMIKRTRDRSTTVEFSEPGSEKFRVYTANDILEYGYHRGTVYISRPVTIVRDDEVITQFLFLESVVTGPVSFFQVRHNCKKYFFIARENSLLVPLNTDPKQSKGKFRNALHQSMSDCDTVSDAIDIARLNKQYLATLTGRYNECDSRIVPRFQVGLFSGLQLSLIDFPAKKTNISSLSKVDFNTEISLLFGLHANVPIEGRFYLQGEMGYSKQSFTSLIKKKMGEDLLKEDLTVELSRCDVTFSLKYSSLHPRIRPYVHGGAGLVFAFNKKNQMILYEKIGAVESTETFDWTDDEMSSVYFKMVLGGGVNFNLNPRYAMFAEIRIEELLASDPPIPNLTGIGLVTGVSF